MRAPALKRILSCVSFVRPPEPKTDFQKSAGTQVTHPVVRLCGHLHLKPAFKKVPADASCRAFVRAPEPKTDFQKSAGTQTHPVVRLCGHLHLKPAFKKASANASCRAFVRTPESKTGFQKSAGIQTRPVPRREAEGPFETARHYFRGGSSAP